MIRILLDIDGTILPARPIAQNKTALTLPESLYSLTFYADVIEQLARISQQENCEIVMCTSWDDTSLDIAKALHIKASRALHFYQKNLAHWYKWDSILDFCTQNSQDKIILCDDLASPENTPHLPKNLVKIIRPNPAYGLTARQLRKIEKIIQKDSKN